MFKGQCYDPDLDERGPSGVLKHGTPRGRRFLNACSTSLLSDDGSILQNEPLPGSSCERGTLMKYRFSDRLWRIEFWNREIHSYFTFYIFYAFSRRFYPKRLTLHSSYSFYIWLALAFPGNRTHDLGVASAMLYHLSYRKAQKASYCQMISSIDAYILIDTVSSRFNYFCNFVIFITN